MSDELREKIPLGSSNVEETARRLYPGSKVKMAERNYLVVQHGTEAVKLEVTCALCSSIFTQEVKGLHFHEDEKLPVFRLVCPLGHSYPASLTDYDEGVDGAYIEFTSLTPKQVTIISEQIADHEAESFLDYFEAKIAPTPVPALALLLVERLRIGDGVTGKNRAQLEQVYTLMFQAVQAFAFECFKRAVERKPRALTKAMD
ncbi:unnamed protein product [Didymodactylos carnosus]|uniref:Uncharacterized protein n=1 Tax=Didymodactylos carnosus TaxID=1234261 RepID=A0A8S2P1W7_9BILA|nr:unnamed protein product [Didymodactylos carnosus]CAF4031452.1 unnamed protein product [Didymodactylos carnosus]